MAKKQPKPPRLTEAVAKRVRKANYSVERHGTCLICGKPWDDCPHNIQQAYIMIEAVKIAEAVGLPLGN